MLTAGIYPDIAAEDYHNDSVLIDQPTLSASIAKLLISASPAHAKAAHPRLNPDFKKVADDKYDIGTAFHSLLLEGESVIEVVAADNWRTKAAQEARELAIQHGRIALLPHQTADVYAMTAAVRERLATFDVTPPMFTNGQPETTILWEEQGVQCRARLDWLHDDHSAIDDLKSTSRSANPESFSKTLYSMGYHIQVRMYQRGVLAVTGRMPEFRYCVVETQPPYALSVMALTPAGEALADEQINHALATWKRCLETNDWPAYPTRVCYAEPPAWTEAAWMAREAMEEAA